MIIGIASESLSGLRHHSVSVDVAVKANRYHVSVEEQWTTPSSGGQLGIEHYEEAKTVTVEYETLEEFFRESAEVFDEMSSLGVAEGIDQELRADAMRAADDQISDVLLFGGAAHLAGDGSGLVIDWDEAKCRKLIAKAAAK